MADIRFLKFATKEIYTNKKSLVLATDIVFIADTREIVVNEVSYGLPADIFTSINNLKEAVDALKEIKHFGGIIVDGTTWNPSTDGGSLKIAGDGKTTVSVTNGTTLTISSPDYDASIAAAKKAGTDAAAALESYQTTNDTAVAAKVASVSATANKGIEVTGTTTAPTVGIKIDTTTPGNVTLETGANGLKANVNIPEATVQGVAANENVISLGTDKKLSTTLELKFDNSTKMLQLLGIGGAVISEFDATAFVKDGMISKDNTKFNPANNKLTIGFNTDAGVQAFDIDLSDLVDTYNGANLKLTAASDFNTDTILDAAIKSLKNSVDSTENKVVSFGGKTGAITVDTVGTAATGTNAVKFVIGDDKKLTAVVMGLGSAAYQDKTYLDASIAAAKKAGDDAQDNLDAYIASNNTAVNAIKNTADSALQSIAKGTDGTFVTTTVSAKSNNTQNVSVTLAFHDVSTATDTDNGNGVAKAYDVKNYVDSCLTWVELT